MMESIQPARRSWGSARIFQDIIHGFDRSHVDRPGEIAYDIQP